MKMVQRIQTVVLWLCLWSAVLLGGCRISPERGPSEPAPTPESPPQANLPANEPSPVQGPESSKQPAKEAIARVFPESLIAAPEKRLASQRVEYNTSIATRRPEARQNSAWQYRINRRDEIVGFEFSNHGGNRILPARRDASKNQFYTRDFQFHFDERSRQDIHLMISDWVASRDRTFRLSEVMNSVMLFFPRMWLPAIVNIADRNVVTLPTGEEVQFDAQTHEIRSGVLSEAPVDVNPQSTPRKFPEVSYHGNGIVVRADAKGKDPRIATNATIVSRPQTQNCGDSIPCNQCQIPSNELWHQSGAVRFKFADDEAFDRFLITRCGFGLPRIGNDFAVVTKQ
jgi:hypothetical protein